jgi:predicted DNA-binding transcriptional regulator AlpA
MTPGSAKASAVVQAPVQLGPLLKVGDLAQLFRVDKRTIKRWCKQGQLPPPLKIGGSNRWRMQDIKEVIATWPK